MAATTAAETTTAAASAEGEDARHVQQLDGTQLLEIRAAQRTFEGAYVRTALGQLGFALVVLKIFSAEFYSVGALFAAYGAGVLAIALYRRHQGNSQFFLEYEYDNIDNNGNDAAASGGGGGGNGRAALRESAPVSRFRTSGNVVLVMTALSLVAYTTLLVLVVRLGNNSG